MKKSDQKPSLGYYAKALWQVARLAFSFSKSAVIAKLFGTLLNASLPFATTFFAAQTTTAIAEAFQGTSGAKDDAIFYVALTVLAALLTMVWSSIDRYIQEAVRSKVQVQVSTMLFERFASIDFWRYDDKDTADAYERSKTFSRIFTYMFDKLLDIASGLFTAIVSIIALSYVSPWLSLILLLAVVPSVIVQLKLSRKQMKLWRENTTDRQRINDMEWNTFYPRNMLELRLHNVVDHLLALRSGLMNKLQKSRLKNERNFLGWRIFADALQSAVELGSLIWVILAIAARSQPVGQFVFVQQIVSRIFTSTGQLIGVLSDIDEDLANLKDYDWFINLAQSEDGSEIAQPLKTLSFEHVSFAYPANKKKVLDDVSLTITAGQHIAIVGENGAGKSTFIKLLLGAYRPTKGAVRLNDKPLSVYKLQSWHKQLAVLLQDYVQYLSATLGDNVRYGDVSKPRSKAAEQDALRQAEAEGLIAELPHGLATGASAWFNKEKGSELSGGQWQRVALARNFYRDAPIIILDEPTSAIDALAEGKIFKRLFAKNNQKTVITISHRLTTVEKADIIYVFEHGKIVEQGVHSDLVAKKGAYWNIFKDQLRGA